MLLMLCAVAAVVPVQRYACPSRETAGISLLPVLGGLFLAPWLTMVCRSPIAGTVFALTIPGVLLVVGELLGMAKYGRPGDGSVQMTFMWCGTLGLCAVGAVMGWRMFMRLEAIEGRDQDVRLPQWLKAAGRGRPHQLTRHNPVWLLVKKELRLQQLPLALAALYVSSGSRSCRWPASPIEILAICFSGLTFLHMGLLPILIGSFASAGERQIDTLQSQLLLPMAAAKQWAVKVGVVFGRR